MAFVHLLPAMASLLLLCAHLLREGWFIVLPLLFLLFPLLVVPRGWVARIWQTVLLVSVLEWGRTAVVLVAERQREGEPWGRALAIVGGVALLAFVSALVFESDRLREFYPRDPLV